RAHAAKRDAGLTEPAILFEETIECPDQLRARAPVDIKRVGYAAEILLQLVAGGQVGMHVGAAKSEDRLLGVAHDKERVLVCPFDREEVEDAPLKRVGILIVGVECISKDAQEAGTGDARV